MLEKLLLAATVTLSLYLLVGVNTPSAPQANLELHSGENSALEVSLLKPSYVVQITVAKD